MGSGASAQYGRLYNKAVESKDPIYAGCWRYEVEYKDKPAYAKTRALIAAPSEQAAITGDVYRWFDRRGVHPCFAPGNVELVLENVASVADDERFLGYVRKYLQKRAKSLVARYGWRYIAECFAGPITTYEEWESLVRGVEFEMQALDEG